MVKKYFSYDPDNGLELHDTEAEAKATAQSTIDYYREDASDGWPDGVDGVCWGELRQRAVEIDTTADNGQGIESCEYQLANI